MLPNISPLLLFTASTLSIAIPQVDSNTGCVSGLYIVIPTGYDHSSNTASEPVETEDLVALAQDITAEIPNSEISTVHYPYISLNIQGAYLSAVDEGTTYAKQHIKRYIDRCGPDSKIALLGYAQGALIASDAYVGSGVNQHTMDGYPDDFKDEKWGPGSGALPDEYAQHVVATAVFASPAAFSQEGYSRGTAVSNGMFASARGPLSVDEGKFRSWCDGGDFLCAAVSQGFQEGSQTEIVQRHRDEAKEFVVEAYGNANDGKVESGSGDEAGDEDGDCKECIDVDDLAGGDDGGE